VTPNARASDKLLYAKTHEWICLDRQPQAKVATVGISAFAVEALTDLVYIELPKVGRQVKRGEGFGEIESVKAVSDLYSPVNGEVIEVNELLTKNLGVLHDDPYGQGWIAKIRLSDDGGLDQLLDYAAYQKQCAEEGH
jgi:glycine cleavage system H protein